MSGDYEAGLKSSAEAVREAVLYNVMKEKFEIRDASAVAPSSYGKALGQRAVKGLWPLLQPVHVPERALDRCGNVGGVHDNVGVLEDPVELAPDVAAELEVYVVVLHVAEARVQSVHTGFRV